MRPSDFKPTSIVTKSSFKATIVPLTTEPSSPLSSPNISLNRSAKFSFIAGISSAVVLVTIKFRSFTKSVFLPSGCVRRSAHKNNEAARALRFRALYTRKRAVLQGVSTEKKRFSFERKFDRIFLFPNTGTGRQKPFTIEVAYVYGD